MASLVVPVSLRFGRFIGENVVNIGKYGTARCHAQTTFLNQWPSSQRSMSAVTSEETKQNSDTTSSEESENEKKLRVENENLTKEIDLLTEKKLELEVADILGKATESVPKEEVRESNPHLKNLYEGLTMTEAQLHQVFKRHGLIPVNPIEEKFDPNLHEALFQQEVQGKEPGTVVVVSKIGYKLHERVIRPALVGVAKGP
ncbi:grpE protein homolog 1, mitochondrial-like isoform X2 [Periplaneta americana]|uniref:grpE protein homolog 1, mitochondrial-like isoform X2 n=1 Tax=Periplaneta americana TaxID=6978 RepID=UPI0037E75E92